VDTNLSNLISPVVVLKRSAITVYLQRIKSC